MPKQLHNECVFDDIDYIYPDDGKGKISFRKILLDMLIISESHPLFETIILSHSALIAEQRRHVRSEQWYVIHPFSKFRMIWELIMFFVITLLLFMEPYVAAFWDRETMETLWTTPMPYFQLFCFCDVPLGFLTGYIKKQNAVMDLKSIQLHYLKRRFILDILVKFPWEMIFLSFKPLWSYEWLRIIIVLKFFRIVDLSNSLNIAGFVFRIPPIVVNVVSFVGFTLVLWWWTAMAQVFIPCIITRNSKYRTHYIGYEDHSMQLYRCIWEGTALFTVTGSELMPALTFDEILTKIVSVMIGLLWEIYALIVVVHDLFRWDRSYARYDVMTKQLAAYMASKRLPPQLGRRILLYYEQRMKKLYFKEDKLLSNMTERLRTELLYHSSERLMRNISLFHKLPRSVVAKLAPHLRMELYLPNDVIIKAGATGDDMYFLASGSVAVYTRWGEEVRHLEDGAYFGEIAMVLKDERRTTSATAVGVCEVYSLHRNDFQRVLRPFRELYRGIERTARSRLEYLLRIEAERRRRRQRAHDQQAVAQAAAQADQQPQAQEEAPGEEVQSGTLTTTSSVSRPDEEEPTFYPDGASATFQP